MTNSPLLLMFLGNPGSGKSYFAKQLARQIGAVRLNGDSMKTAIYGSYDYIRANNLIDEANQYGFSALNYAVEEVLRAGHSVVYDANNLRRSTRKNHEALARKYGALPIVVWVQTPPAIARERALGRELTPDQPTFTQTQYEQTLSRLVANFEDPTEDELVIAIDGTAPFEEQYVLFQKGVERLLK